jgi:glyoxylase I family protein
MGYSDSLIKGIEHIAIATTEPHRLADWYVKHLDCEVVLVTDNTVYIKSANSVVLEFVRAQNVLPRPQILDAGLRHIAFSVDDLEKAHARLEALGVQFESKPVVLPGMRLHFFRDLEGNVLHLIRRDKTL